MSKPSDREALMDAVRDDNLRKVKALLKKGVDPDFEESGRTPLDEAIRGRNLGIVKALVDGGADVNRESGYGFVREKPLDIADTYGDTKIIEYLEQKGATSDDPRRLNAKQQALMDAITLDDEKKVTGLLDAGLDPDFGGDDTSPLEEAVTRGNESIVRALVDSGADVNRRNFLGETPLDIATDRNDTAIVNFLKSEGAVSGRPPKGSGARVFQKGTRPLDRLL